MSNACCELYDVVVALHIRQEIVDMAVKYSAEVVGDNNLQLENLTSALDRNVSTMRPVYEKYQSICELLERHHKTQKNLQRTLNWLAVVMGVTFTLSIFAFGLITTHLKQSKDSTSTTDYDASREGIIFADGADPTQSFYAMFDYMRGKMTPHPNWTAAKPIPPIPMEEAFAIYVEQIRKECAIYDVKLRDYVIHRLAFLLSAGGDGFNLGEHQTAKKWIFTAKKEARAKPWNYILPELARAYKARGWGWHGNGRNGLLSNADTWNAEVIYAAQNGIDPRLHLFPGKQRDDDVYERTQAKQNEALHKLPPHQAAPPPVVSGDKQVRIDAAHFDKYPLFARLAEKIGEKRFDLWFGQDTTYTLEGNNART